MLQERERNRIRDNQRRSRARKKEYVQELEQRLRDCQLKGIEASAEVQQAARRVAEENQKLRQLLGEVGLGDHQVDQYLRTDVLDHGDGRDFQAHAAAGRKQGHAVNALDSIMTARRPDSLDLSRPFPATGHQARSDQASAYDTASNSPSESYGALSEDAQQPPYRVDSAASMSVPSQPAYVQTRGPRFPSDDHVPQSQQPWLPGDPTSPSGSVAINMQSHASNQSLHFHPAFPRTNSTTSLPTSCQGHTASPYAVYDPLNQAQSFISPHLGTGSAGHSGPGSLCDTDSSAEDRRNLQTGNLRAFPWPQEESTHPQYGAHDIVWRQYSSSSSAPNSRPPLEQQLDPARMPRSDRRNRQ